MAAGSPDPLSSRGKKIKGKRKRDLRVQPSAVWSQLSSPKAVWEPLLSHIGAAAPGTATARLDPSSSPQSSRCSHPVPSTGLLEKLP